jgi:hypothetical protein
MLVSVFSHASSFEFIYISNSCCRILSLGGGGGGGNYSIGEFNLSLHCSIK